MAAVLASSLSPVLINSQPYTAYNVTQKLQKQQTRLLRLPAQRNALAFRLSIAKVDGVVEPTLCSCRSDRSAEAVDAAESNAATHRNLLLSSPVVVLSSIGAAAVARAEVGDFEGAPVPVDSSDAAVNIAISVLLTSAFVGLIVLTAGVIYLAYTDWRDKRELEAEANPPTISETEPPKPKKVRLGPKGFGGDIDRSK